MVHTTDLSDEHSEMVQYCSLTLTNFGGRKAFHGPIATVQVYEDNVLYLEALESVAAGTVIVVDGGGSMRCALMGDRLGKIAVERGIPGVIINACIRDSAELATLDVGVLALGTHPRKSQKRGEGQRGGPLAFGDVIWTPGQFVYADADGVIVSPEALV